MNFDRLKVLIKIVFLTKGIIPFRVKKKFHAFIETTLLIDFEHYTSIKQMPFIE